MARTSQTPRGRASQSDFDAMLRQEIARSSGRGGETDVQGARDRLARRMNIQEGRTGGGATSTAYRPAAPAQRASSGSKSKPSRGKPSRSAPAPSGGLPDTGPVLPDRPADPAADPGGGGWPGWLLPLLLAASRKGTRMMGGEGAAPPDQSGGALEPRRVTTQPVAQGTGDNIVDAEYEVMRRPLPIAGPGDARPIPYSPEMGRLPPPANATDDALGRFMTDSEIQDMAMRARMYPDMESGMGGAGGGRLGGQVYRPGIDMPAPSPGMHGSKFAQPILKHIVP